jgi:hypothetical protein
MRTLPAESRPLIVAVLVVTTMSVAPRRQMRVDRHAPVLPRFAAPWEQCQRRGRWSRERVKNLCVSLAKYFVQTAHIGGLVG